jgi:hypothetical protein
VLPIYTSFIWFQTNEMNIWLQKNEMNIRLNEMNIIPLLSFTCLFLDLKFLLFFRPFESFGVYFAIIISVAKKIVSFVVVLLIIIISFAHAFYILLSPKTEFSLENYTNNNDPNNPWNLSPTYIQVFENGTTNSNSSTIQKPDGNTNMFINFKTALFAMYLFLTGMLKKIILFNIFTIKYFNRIIFII